MPTFFYKTLRYGLVGSVVFAAQFATLIFLVENHLASPLVASILAFGLALILSFFLHRRVTFLKVELAGIRREFVLTFILSLSNLGFNALAMHGLLTAGVNYLIAQLLVTGLIVVYTFIAYHYIFRL